MSTQTGQGQAARHQGVAAADLPVEGMMPSFAGANGWLNSQPLTPSGLRGHVVVVQFWTYTCINWLRTQAYNRAWSQRYRDQGLVTIGVHTPEFKFEHDLDNVRWAVQARKIDYPVAIDNDFEVWRAFANHYWPALYFIDAEGRIRHHRFGEGDYERSEMVIRQLLADAGVEDLRPGLASVEPNGDEVQADWEDLGSPESYLGYDQATGFEAGGRADVGQTSHLRGASAPPAQPLGTHGRLDRPVRRERAQRSWRTSRVSVPRARREPRDGAGEKGREREVSRSP